MSSCLSGGGRSYGFDIDIMKSPSTSTTRASHSSSPSSTISESSNSPPLAISTRKPRTPRKRPNQTYNEAAALLSTIYPNIFPSKNLRKPCKNTRSYDSFSEEFSELLPPYPSFNNAGFLLDQLVPQQPSFRFDPKPSNSFEKSCQSPTNSDFQLNYSIPCDEYHEDFDAESILDEEIEEGIDSIMGNLSVDNDSFEDPNAQMNQINPCYGNSLGFGFGGKFEFGFGMGMEMMKGVRALRHVDDGDWWRNPTIDIIEISPKFNKVSLEKIKKKKKKKKTKVEVPQEEMKSFENSRGNSVPNTSSGLLLKLNFDGVLNAWSDRGSPFSDEIQGVESSESDAIARLAQIDLFSENGGVREASVLRYREKRRSRLFSKKIRYQVRKVNADRRPRMKGRFVRRPNSALSVQR